MLYYDHTIVSQHRYAMVPRTMNVDIRCRFTKSQHGENCPLPWYQVKYPGTSSCQPHPGANLQRLRIASPCSCRVPQPEWREVKGKQESSSVTHPSVVDKL